MTKVRDVQRRYVRELLSAMAGYVAVLYASLWLLRNRGAEIGAPLKAVLALLPMLPIAFAARAIVRVIRDSDELEQRIDLEAAAIAGLVVGLGYLTLGLLASAEVITLDGSAMAVWVFPSLCGTFGLAKWWTSGRFRG